jgi:hypothetical protein
LSAQPSVLQIVIMRDGLLVGTEVFVPGQYTLGSGEGVDLKLEDPGVAASHAFLYFQNGKAAIQDGGKGLTFVNGHKVSACEVRAVDEIACGPFTLKIRVMGQKPASKPAPPPEVAALLGAARPAPPQPVAPQQPQRPQPPSTVVSNRRMGAAPAAAEPIARPSHLRSVQIEDETRTESFALGSQEFEAPTAQQRHAPDEELLTMPLPMPAAPPSRNEGATVQARAHAAAPAAPAAQHSRPAPAPARAPAPVPAAPAPARGHAPARAVPQSRGVFSPTVPSSAEGKGRPNLFVELYWGDTRRYSNSYKKIDAKKKLIARADDTAPLPLYGFAFDGDFTFAEQKADLFRVFVPPGAAVERRAQDGKFYPVQLDTLEQSPDSRRCVTLGSGHAVRFSAGQDVLLMAYVQPAIPRPFVNPLKGLPWLALAVLSLFMSGFGAFVFYFAEVPAEPDFTGKTLSPVAVKLIAPPKPEEKKKLEEKVEKIKKEEKKKDPVAKKPEPPKTVVPQETKKALKSIEKLAAAGPAMKDLLAAVDKLGSGPGAKNAKNDFKLSGLIGKAPIANAGIGTFGLGGGGAGGMGIKGAELLRGKGGGGIGALGAGNIGKGSVAGTVTRAATRNIGAQGTIDKEAVAKVINSHLHEVSSCYERALLKTPGLAGKIVLEWQITTTGSVGFAKTKSSSMQSPAVESCILASLKTWRFPQAKGAGVVITYPFMFNSVGY